MSRRRQRRFSLAPSADRVPAPSPSPPSPTAAPRSRAKSWSAARPPLLRRQSVPSRPSAPSPPPPPSTVPYVPVRVRDFVLVPPARLAAPALALGPLDSAARPPSYDLALAARRRDRVAVATQTAPDWDPVSVDRALDLEFHSDVSDDDQGQQDPHPPHRKQEPSTTEEARKDPPQKLAPPVFMIDDRTHVNRLVTIVNASDTTHAASQPHHGPRRAAAPPSSQQNPSLPVSIDSPFSSASSSTTALSTTSSCLASNASPLSSAFSTGHATSASFGSSLDNSDPPQPHEQDPTLYVLPPTPPRRRLFNNKVPSPVKYTFRPPVPAPPKPLSPLPLTAPARCQDRGETSGTTAVVPLGLPYRHRRQSSEYLSAVSPGPPGMEPITLTQVKGVVDAVDPAVVLKMASPPLSPPLLAVSIFRKTGKRESNESGRSSGSSSTEYYEDEYTKFIEKKSGSPLRLRGKPYLTKKIPSEPWGTNKGSRIDCRSNSTVSVATSDDEYHPILGRLSNA